MRNLLIVAAALASPAAAQTKPPLRPLGPIVATSAELVGTAIIVRATSSGVIVNSAARQRVYMFDSTLANVTVLVDSGTGTGMLAVRTSGLIPFTGDSTLLPDIGSRSLLVLDGTGKTARVMAPPKPQDLVFLSTPAAFGRPGFDPNGRLVYRTMAIPNMRSAAGGMGMTQMMPDSSAIVRADLDTRTVDTVAWVRTPSQARMSMEQTPGGAMSMKMVINPFQETDEWALLRDGTIAIVRAHDYHVDWVDPDGSRRTSAKMPFDWKRFTDEEKQAKADSAKESIQTQMKTAISSQQMPPGMQLPQISIDVVPLKEIPDYWPSIQPGSVQADLENRLWILPTTSVMAAGGLTYDVVDRTGVVVERVQLPPGRALVGFGPGGAVYLTHTEGAVTRLERARIR